LTVICGNEVVNPTLQLDALPPEQFPFQVSLEPMAWHVELIAQSNEKWIVLLPDEVVGSEKDWAQLGGLNVTDMVRMDGSR